MLIFTDLDATLLDHETYSVEEAMPMLAELKRKGIPVIPVTSKTRHEVQVWRGQLGLDGPYVTENGAGVYLPAAFAEALGVGALPNGNDVRLHEPMGYAEIRRVFKELGSWFSVVGFGDLTSEELASHTGLSPQECALAQRREFSEPFLLLDPAALEPLERLAAARGLRVQRGGRFLHLLDARAGKGVALRMLRGMYEQLWKVRPTTIALGDSPNDLEMLRAADRGIVVPHPAGLNPEMDVPGLEVAPHAGPSGWAEAVRRAVGWAVAT